MTLDQIYYFTEIAKTGSMSQVARNLHISQPNISMTIGVLEKELGYTLFNRMPKGVELTRQGAEFLHHAELIISNIEEMRNIRQTNKDSSIDFSVSAQFSSACVYPLIEMLHLFEKEKKTFSIRQNPFFDVVEDVKSGHSNLGILNISAEQENFIKILLAKNGLEFVLITDTQMSIGLAEGHPLYDCPQIALSDLKAYPLVLVEHSVKDYLSVETIKQLETESFKTKIFVQDMLLFYQLLDTVHGVTFVAISKNHDITHIFDKYHMNLKLIPLAEPVIIKMGYIKQKSRPLNFAEQHFVDSLYHFLND
ncbi:LysR family transcriptional regulator [Fusibacter ferrireducens]|uniref:LysR family transcriptional regulator n=1 Tax=Fusibacter ferrireducens TaxID=2785058 RepID=A0ABR9ZYK1_9FIRM|nr:LysR family transcriptional regulator [Fusibacter ferrireducens]MBF4695529.1 LysR family transcriptional regulator [Fusibacter ferrireducens]